VEFGRGQLHGNGVDARTRTRLVRLCFFSCTSYVFTTAVHVWKSQCLTACRLCPVRADSCTEPLAVPAARCLAQCELCQRCEVPMMGHRTDRGRCIGALCHYAGQYLMGRARSEESKKSEHLTMTGQGAAAPTPTWLARRTCGQIRCM
jgi:hypothetical protein